METFETDDQQAEAIKKWWRDNYKMVILLIVVGVSSILGTQYYKENTIIMADAASDNFNAVLEAKKQKQVAIIADRTQLLQKDFQSTPYAAQATMIWASSLADEGKKQEAIDKLVWVEANTQDKIVKQIALIQKVQLMASLDQNDQALKILKSAYTEDSSFSGLNLETQADILVAMGKVDEAKKQYDSAMGKYLLAGMNVEFISIKRNDLGK